MEEYNSPAEALKSYSQELAGYKQRIGKVQTVLRSYNNKIEELKDGDIEQEEFEEYLESVSQHLLGLKDHGQRLSSYDLDFESEPDILPELASYLADQHGFEVPEEDVGLEEYRSLRDQMLKDSEGAIKTALRLDSDFLQSKLGKDLAEVYEQKLEPEERRDLRRFLDAEKAQQLMENTRERQNPYIKDTGTKSIEEAMKRVRKQGPRFPLSQESREVSEKEFEANKKSIEEALERREGRRPRYIQ
ncbi:hypothetical protein [Candidatus Nanohalococcus occultus]|uniref:hypothetical protein n=1 Tax=Candidatus Nanohalococcus occultus TaxID=2978047 RepID=UPI0039DF5AE9